MDNESQREPLMSPVDTNQSGLPPQLSQPTEEETPRRREGWRSAISTILILIAAPLIALALTQFVFQSYEVDGPSMETTLDNRDRLIVLKLPRTLGRLTNKPYIPERGEIIVFTKPGAIEVGQSRERQLIKRVIGVPGDKVVVKDGTVTVFNSEYPAGFQPDKTMPYGSVIGTTPGQNIEVMVPDGEVFVLGDNRINSLDSRVFGPVLAEDIVGKLAVRILPLSKMQKF